MILLNYLRAAISIIALSRISYVLCYYYKMRELTTVLCLTITVLFGSARLSQGADFQKGLTAAQSGDFATALSEWTPLAEQGRASAQFNLGQLYRRGQGVPQDYTTAVRWFTLAAEQSHAKAQYNLGLRYWRGQGVPQDDKAAVKWFTLAAKQGEARAQYNLGVTYEKGKGIPRNYKTAVKWYRLAAEQGYADAQYNLGLMYGYGEGVALDFTYAYMWWDIAASSGKHKKASENREIAAKKMSPSQIKKAQGLVRACIRKKYKGC